ncbi:MAG: signal peptidase II, partial [Caldilineaceae bacterium]|nr:signal peptidase II [Caldilineaceae bacterium]
MHYLSKWLRRAWPVLLVATIIISLDQWTKELIRQSVAEYSSVAPIPALSNYLVFERVRNYGAAFGILQ